MWAEPTLFAANTAGKLTFRPEIGKIEDLHTAFHLQFERLVNRRILETAIGHGLVGGGTIDGQDRFTTTLGTSYPRIVDAFYQRVPAHQDNAQPGEGPTITYQDVAFVAS